MSADAIWSAFTETGEPALYLLYRAAEAQTNHVKEVRGE